MYCPNCGTKTIDTAKFCMNCGEPFSFMNQNPSGNNVNNSIVSENVDRFCTFCKRQMSKEALFCRYCGRDLLIRHENDTVKKNVYVQRPDSIRLNNYANQVSKAIRSVTASSVIGETVLDQLPVNLFQTENTASRHLEKQGNGTVLKVISLTFSSISVVMGYQSRVIFIFLVTIAALIFSVMKSLVNKK